MGCLKNIFKAALLVLAVFGLTSIIGKDQVTTYVNDVTHQVQSFFNPPQDVMLKRAQKVGDFSKIGDEYEIDKAASAFGYNGVLAEHKSTGQKMIVIDPGDKPLLTPEDFKDGKVDKKLHDITQKFKYQFVNIQDLKITKKGHIRTFGQRAPYVRFEAKANKLPVGDIGGIVSAVKTKSGETKVIVSVNEKDKYSQVIADDFFRKIKEEK